MSYYKYLPFTILCACLTVPNSALAQSDSNEFNRENGQVITSLYYTNSTRGFDADGENVDIADFEKIEVFALVEYNVTKDLTLIVKPSFRNFSIEGGDETTGLGYTDVGARYDVLESQNGWLAIEGSVRIPGVDVVENLAQVGSTDTEYDTRIRGFHNISIGNIPAFIDVQAGYRFRDGEPPNEYRADVSFGIRPAKDILLLAQSFNTISDGSGQGIFDSFRYHNVQFSAVKDVSDKISLQLGAIGTIDGENALRERGVFGGVWIKF